MEKIPLDTLPLSKRLSYRQARLVVIIAVGLGMLFSCLQIYLDYFSTQKEFDSTINQLVDTIKQPAIQAAYTLDRGLAEKVVHGVLHYQAIYKVELLDDSKEILAKDNKALIETQWRWISELIFGQEKIYQIPLFLPQNSQFGLLKITVDTHFMAISFLERGLVILMSGLARHLLLAALLLYLFHYIVTKPLFNIAITLASIDPFQPEKDHLSSPPGHDEDELGQLVNSINQLLKFIRKGITEREHILQEMAVAKQAAEAANEAKTLFLQKMSHELRTPMNGVMGMLQLTLYTELTPTQGEYLEIAQTSGEHLLGLIDDLLDISTIEKGKVKLIKCEPFEISKVVEETAESLAEQAYRKQLELITLVALEVPQWVKGDRARFRQIITNLLDNAIKFTEQGEVFIQVNLTLADDKQVLLYCEVSDTGIGIPKEMQPYIFDIFNQGDDSLTRQYGGAGIGLTLCKQLVELMGGRIDVQSEPGQGSTFWFSVMLQPAEQPVVSPISDNLKGLRILIVDDSVNQRRVLSEYLTRWEVVYDTADTASLALNKLRAAALQTRPFDIVIVDQDLLEAEGASLSRRIKTDVNIVTTRLIILTPLLAPTSSTGLDIYLNKPFRQMQLYQAIQQAVSLQPVPLSQLIPAIESLCFHDEQKNILLVEDNTFNQKVALSYFNKLGLHVDIAHNGPEAVSKLAQSHYDAIFMDCQMPEMDGYEATRLIRQQEVAQRHIPIIAITANAMETDPEHYLADLMDDYISKPFNLETLRDMLRRWILSS